LNGETGNIRKWRAASAGKRREADFLQLLLGRSCDFPESPCSMLINEHGKKKKKRRARRN
jgi:hypothetical protein